jgi:glutathione-specific gamma-glutamylcyclotransferase
LLQRVRSMVLPGITVKSDAEIEASLDAILAEHDPGQDLWLFAYGSLMWNPAFYFAERAPALLRAWHRRFCLWLSAGRGSPATPGLMLALDRGGSCHGIAYRVAAPARDELLLVWRREMFGNAYRARWVQLAMPEGSTRGITFVANPRHDRYADALSDETVAARLASAGGPLGSCADYLRETMQSLHALGLRDRGLERIEHLVGQQLAETVARDAASPGTESESRSRFASGRSARFHIP